MLKSEQRAQEGAELQLHNQMKTFLKQQSKNRLIQLVFEQINLYQTLQGATKQVYEENAKLKSELESLKPLVPQTDVAKEPS